MNSKYKTSIRIKSVCEANRHGTQKRHIKMKVKDIGIVLTLAELIVELVMKCFYSYAPQLPAFRRK
jgi:hypothetical protein